MAQQIQDDNADDGFQFIYVVTGDNSNNVPDQADLESWADTYGFDTVPALAVPDSQWSFDYELDAYIPTTYVLDRDMKVVSADEMVDDPGPWL